ncbi:acetate--CoA ligase family protein [Pseudonocardia sp. GCM10023141]|uniref:acetate--CoA ligase family protein n=1 Tax=Pseudonocardia sp. GCM10023141 TaxID=3252653 RepID=UPI00361A486B
MADVPSVMASRPSLRRLFTPRSVAVIGATDRADSLGGYALHNILGSEGIGEVYPVNPGRAEIAGRRCYARLRDVPEVDLAYVLLPAAACAQALADCAEHGVPFAIVASSGFGEGGAATATADLGLSAQVRAVTRVVGPNTNGLWNARAGIRIGFNTSHGMVLRPGRVALVSQSGAVLGSAIAALDGLGVGLAYAVATGNEADLAVPDYVAEFLADDDVAVVGLLLDGLEDPARLLEVLVAAQRPGRPRTPVVALKMGASAAGRHATELHASRVADPAQALQAWCARAGVAVTADLEDFLATLAVLGSGRTLPADTGVLAMSTSGAGAALLADGADAAGLTMAPLPAAARERLAGLMRMTEPHNPLDITGESRVDGWVHDVFTAFADAAPEAPLTYLVTLLKHATDARSHEFAVLAGQQPHRLFLACPPSPLPAATEAELRDAGVLVLRSTRAVFGGLAGAHAARAAARAGVDPAWVRAYVAGVARPVPAGSRVLLHDDARTALAAVGVPFLDEAVVADAAAAQSAAAVGGGPVALKLLAMGQLHKAAAGGVVLGVAAPAVRERAAALLADAPPDARVLVQAMAPAGLDLFVGFERHERFGPMLMVGAGGSDVERDPDVATLLLPTDAGAVRAALAGLRIGRVLGASGPAGPAWAVDAAVAAVLAFASHVDDGVVRAAEINPLRVLPAGAGAVALDVRMVLGEDG